MEVIEYLRKLGRKGGASRAAKLSPAKRKAIAKKGAAASARVRSAKAKAKRAKGGK